MGNWTIVPDNGLATIDSEGNAVFQKTDEDIVYTVTYNSASCGSVSKQITVKACVKCTCSTTGGLEVPAEASDTLIPVGTYTANDCDGSFAYKGIRSGVEFLKDITFDNGNIYARVKLSNESEEERLSEYNAGIEDCSDYFTVRQKGKNPTPPPPGPTCNSTTQGMGYCLAATGGTLPVGTYTSMEGCSGVWAVQGQLPSWISHVDFRGNQIFATLEPNPSSERRETVVTYLEGKGQDSFEVWQCDGTVPPVPGACTCENIESKIRSTNLIFDSKSYSEVMFAEYYTEECGSVSATSYSEIFDGDIRTIAYDSAGIAYDDYVENAFKYAIVGSLLANTTGKDRSGGISIHVKPKGYPTWGECPAKLYAQQKVTICSCNDISIEAAEKTEEVIANDGAYAYSQKYTLVPTCDAVRYNISEGEEYVNDIYIRRSSGQDYCVVRMKENKSESQRTVVVNLSAYVNVSFNKVITNSYTNNDWNGGTTCLINGTLTINQKEASICTCDDIDVNKVKIGSSMGRPYENNTIVIDSPSNGTAYASVIVDKECSSFSDGTYPKGTASDTDFITDIRVNRYESDDHMWVITITYSKNTSTEERQATLSFTFCDGKTFTSTIKQAAGVNCNDCQADFINKLSIDTTVSGRSYGVSSDIGKYTGSCEIKVAFVDGKPNWVERFEVRKIVGYDSIKPWIKENMTTNERSVKYKVYTENIEGCESEVYTFHQKGANPCTYDNVSANLVGISKSGDQQTVGENTTFTAGTVTITTEETLLDCITPIVETSQPEYIDEASLSYEDAGSGLTSDYKVFRSFRIICKSKTVSPGTESQAATVDVNLQAEGRTIGQGVSLQILIKK